MNQTRMVARTEAVKKRREYVRKMTAARSIGVIGACYVLGGGYFGVSLLVQILRMGLPISNWIYAYVLALTMTLALLGGMLWYHSAKASKTIEYVPPIAAQLAALPAEEVLLRGSDQPAAAPDELLRAVGQALQTVPVEPLRPTEKTRG